MTPSDVKAIRILAEHLGLDGVGYNPRANDEQANELVEKFGLEVRYEQKSRWIGFVAYKDGKELAAMGCYGDEGDHRRHAIVHAAARLAKPGWEEHFNCFKEGLDPFEIGHIVDARR